MTTRRRLLRQVLFVFAHLVLVFVPTPRLWAEAPPAVRTAARQVLVIRDGSGRCLGAPISATLIVTARHCTENPQVGWQTRDGRRGLANVILRRPELDLALVRVEGAGDFPFWLRIADRLPDEVEAVWAHFFVPGTDVYALTEGRFMAEVQLGEDRHCVLVDGMTGPGSSGGVLLNERGEVVAVHSQSWNPGAEVGGPARGLLVRPLAIFRSLVGAIGRKES